MLSIFFEVSERKAISFSIAFFILLIVTEMIFNNYYDNKLSIQLAINKKIIAEHHEFNIIKNNTTFTDQNSTLIFSELVEPNDAALPYNFNEQTKILVNNLYQSTITNNFFWYRYVVLNSEVIEEQIVTVEEDAVKEFLLKTDKAIYLKIFGEPNPY